MRKTPYIALLFVLLIQGCTSYTTKLTTPVDRDPIKHERISIYDKGVACYDKKDFKCALSNFLKSAEKGDANAQYNIGLFYNNGKGVKQDYFKAFEWFMKAAKQGYFKAQYYVGVYYNNGKGVRQDKSMAKKWFGKACDNRSQMGCDNLKTLNEQGY